jgi:hypothetical protein
MTDENREKKIIVDEDWKSQVEAEKEALRHQQAEPDAPDEPAPADDEFELPPASFPLLVTSFATQALSALGQVPDPIEGKTVVRLPVARHLIDSLAVLEEKTKGNLTTEEQRMLTDWLHQLRMIYVSVQNSAGRSAGASGTAGEGGE